MNGSNVLIFLFLPCMVIEGRKTGLHSHNICHETSQTTITFPEWMNNNEFNVHSSDCSNGLFPGHTRAWRVFSEKLILEYAKKERQAGSGSKKKVTLTEIYRPYFSSPCINIPSPLKMPSFKQSYGYFST